MLLSLQIANEDDEHWQCSEHETRDIEKEKQKSVPQLARGRKFIFASRIFPMLQSCLGFAARRSKGEKIKYQEAWGELVAQLLAALVRLAKRERERESLFILLRLSAGNGGCRCCFKATICASAPNWILSLPLGSLSK